MMKVLVFQHICVEHPGIFRDFMNQDGIVWDTVELDEGESIPDLTNYGALMVMGGPMNVWEQDQHPWLVEEKAMIRHAIADLNLPCLGFCLGHQLMAEALGGKVGAMMEPEVGIRDVELTEQGMQSTLFAGLHKTMRTLQWHAAEVTEPPPDSFILATSPACAIQALQYTPSAFSMQYHIELTDSTISDWGKVPEYKESLEKTMGPGALATLDREVKQYKMAFHDAAKIIYDHFIDHLH